MAKTGEAYVGSFKQRAFDVSGALSLAVVASPLVAVSGLALTFETGGSPVFRQNRIGKNGNEFTIFKLRTLAGQDRSGQIELGGSEHPLAGKIGKFVRKIGLDEAPQLLNVLKGDLHLVGVRTQIPITLEQRRDADPILFDDWLHWATRNPGLFSPGGLLAHLHSGAYTENSELIRNVMRAEVAHSENASLSNDLRFLVSAPLTVLEAGISMYRHNPETQQ